MRCPSPLAAILTGAALTGLAACEREGDRVRDVAGGKMTCDSAQAARTTLDSLGRLDPFRSVVYRYEPDSAGVRIVTWPAEVGTMTDGMAIVRLGRSCRITSLVQTDSA